MAGRGERLAVVLDAPELGPTQQIGTLVRWPGAGQLRAVSFAYDDAWLEQRNAFQLDPRTLLFLSLIHI